MSADGNIVKESLSGGKVADLPAKLNIQAFKCKSCHYSYGTNDITSDDSPKD